jgi:hypothetical protein
MNAAYSAALRARLGQTAAYSAALRARLGKINSQSPDGADE